MQQHIKSVTYNHVVLEGTPYDVGKFQGAIIKHVPEAVNFFASGQGKLSEPEYAHILKLCDDLCPDLNEEINGFADSLGVSATHIVYYAQSYLKARHCSHFAVLPAISKNGHVLVGRSYEFSDTMDDLRLCTTHIKGKFAHIGFSTLLFGRTDGLNEHGLSVTMSAAGMPVGSAPGMKPPVQDGFMFWALIRSILEQCQTIEEALELVKKFPLCCNLNLIIVHKSGNAALVELSGLHHVVKLIDASSDEQFLCSTNHLTSPEMIPHIPTGMENSFVRYNTIESRLKQAAPSITKETMRGILTDRYPEGLCNHYFEEFFGTLYSMIFDLTEGSVEICFGPPSANDWHIFNLTKPAEPAQYTAKLPREHADPEFWKQLPVEV
jgi:predicted choloylglycine hydrolase